MKIYGRDAWDGQLLTSIWSSLWNRGQTPEVGGRLHQVEHEAFVTLFAERQGVPTMPVVAAGMAAGRDAVLVVATGDAQPLARLDPARVDDAVLTRIWQLDARLFDLRIAHGALDGYRVAVYSDGTPAVGDFSQATVSAADAALRADRAQLLVSTALLVDHARAVTIARDVLGADVDRRHAALPATGGARPGHAARRPGPGLGPGRPAETGLGGRGRRAAQARTDPPGDVGVDRHGRGDRPRRLCGDLGGRQRRAQEPDRRVPRARTWPGWRSRWRSRRRWAWRRRSQRSAPVSSPSGSGRW